MRRPGNGTIVVVGQTNTHVTQSVVQIIQFVIISCF